MFFNVFYLQINVFNIYVSNVGLHAVRKYDKNGLIFFSPSVG